MGDETNRHAGASQRRGGDATILLLALAGAGVDAIVILGFGVLTAAQTGNTILLAVALAQEKLDVGMTAAVSVAAYVAGAAAAELVVVRREHGHPRAEHQPGLLLAEALLLAGALALWRYAGPNPRGASAAVLVSLAAIAMGIQSVVVLRRHASVTTTYVTGMLTTFTTGIVRRLRTGASNRAAAPRAPCPAPDDSDGDRLMHQGWTWLVYLASAVACGALHLHAAELALLVPIGALLAVAAIGRPVREASGR